MTLELARQLSARVMRSVLQARFHGQHIGGAAGLHRAGLQHFGQAVAVVVVQLLDADVHAGKGLRTTRRFALVHGRCHLCRAKKAATRLPPAQAAPLGYLVVQRADPQRRVPALAQPMR